jgi:transmembrane sensor
MEEYNQLAPEDFVMDDYFRKWVNRQLPPEDDAWEKWLSQHPEKEEAVSQAKFILKALEMKHLAMDDSKTVEKIQNILWLSKPSPSVIQPTFFEKYGFKIAASVLILCGLVWVYFQNQTDQPTKYEQLVTTHTVKTIEKINNSNEALTVSLSDGSTIILQPKSRLSFPETFAGDKREVFLSGEAFFEIAKNPEKPFLVYANELVTKVLGTSFSIKAFEQDKDIVVKVFTGKVSVLSGKEINRQGNQPFSQNEGVILTPNQMVVFDREPERLTKTLVENPLVLALPDEEMPKIANFNFENTPVTEVFETLEKSYGVKIVFDNEMLKNCTVTAPLENESLYEKLNLICSVVRATYEVVDAQIIISSKGCN